ncbi:hypothetical protein KEM55_006738 [Ascosphaera atra]|nr:hypothetical protein KEM55_006738 [Ascosphaera atra]
MGKRNNRLYGNDKGASNGTAMAQPSDYETDLQEPYLSEVHGFDGAIETAASGQEEQEQSFEPVPARSIEDLNLGVVRRHHPDVESIRHMASYAVVYTFDTTTVTWEKSGIEGTLFVCKLTPGSLGEERYTVFIINRRALDNFVCQLVNPDDVEITPEYIILKVDEKEDDGITVKPEPSIYGLWIFTEPPPKSTAMAMVKSAQTIKECATLGYDSLKFCRERAALEAKTAQQAETTSMSRQMSLHELFDQQRQQDDAWTIRAHHEPQAATAQTPAATGTNPSATTPVVTGNALLDQLFSKAALGGAAGPRRQ